MKIIKTEKYAQQDNTGEGFTERQPWQMTKEEYIKQSKDYYDLHGNYEWLRSKYHSDVTQQTNNEAIKSGRSTIEMFHIQHIKNALSKGLPVPPEVLADYPELNQSKNINENNENY